MDSSVTSVTDIAPRAGRREWTALAVLALPALLVSIDVFVLLLAMPHLSADLGASSTEQLWILDVYGFLLAGFMITMGTLGDRVGRKKLLLIGAAAFAAASVLAAFSVSPLMLIVARALLGVAGATLAPSTLALISNLFPDAAQRAQAIGIWLVCFMGGAVVGPLVGGVMLEHFWWGSVFLLGVPAMALLLVLGPSLLPEFRDPGAGRLDLRSVGLSLAAILPVIYGLKELARAGWQPLPVLWLLVGLGFAGAFAARQRRLADPLLDLALFRNTAFSTAVVGMHLLTWTGAMMFFITQLLQLVHGLAPLEAGLWLIPGAAGSVVGFAVAPVLARRIRPAYLIAAGLALSVVGLALFTRADPGTSLPALAVGFLLMNLGAAPMVTLATDIVVGSVPPEKAGSAAATSETVAELGYSLGIAVLGSVAAAVYAARLVMPDVVPAAADDAARESLTGAVAAAADLPAAAAGPLLGQASAAFMDGVNVVALVCAALAAGVGALALTTLRHLPPSRPRDAGPSRPPSRPRDAGTAGADRRVTRST